MSQTNIAGTEQAQAFERVLGALAGGELLMDCSERLAELVDAVKATGKPGTLTLVLTVAPVGEAMMVDGQVSIAKPAVQHGGTVMFPVQRTVLQQGNPRQREMPFVDGKAMG